jgi:hypothetical protein
MGSLDTRMRNWFYKNVSPAIDLYQAPVPQFTLDGRSHKPSCTGVIVSLLTYAFVGQFINGIFRNLVFQENAELMDLTTEGIYGKADSIELTGLKPS